MTFELLDDRIRRILNEKNINEPTGPQREAIPRILQGEHLLLVAPTGIGKTEAAMLPIFHRLLRMEGKGIKCLYITPLRALNRDMLRRLEEFGNALGIGVAVRHGDTSQAERNRQSKTAPDVLITTPETLQIMFTGKRLKEHLSRVKWVVVDEIHELANDERGAQLAVALERLARIAGEFQRIGLSATVGTVEEVANFLGGVGRDVRVVRTDVAKEMEVTVQCPEVTDPDRDLAGTLQCDPQLVACMRMARDVIEAHRSTLLFVNTRDTAEALAARYHVWDESLRIGVHHGSLSKEIRVEMEEAFKKENLKGLICTSSLELGIDIGTADFAIQYNSPRQVTRLIQRMGRAGHKVGEKSKGVVIASTPDEIAESLVVSRRAMAGELEELTVRENPFTVLANQLVSMAMSGQVAIEEAYGTIARSYPYRNLSREDFDSVLDQLGNIGLLFVGNEYFRRSTQGMRYFYDNVSMIPDEKTFKIRDIGSRSIVGSLDESFVVSFAEPYATFITRGRTWRIIEVREDELLVEQVKEIGSIPSWIGEEIPVPFEVAQEVGRLRRLEDIEDYPGENDADRKLRDYLGKQKDGFPMPSDSLLTLEVGKKLAILNACFGTRVNETISRLLSVLLTARLGESVLVHTDPYRIVIELPRDLNPALIIQTLRSIKPDGVESLVRLMMKSSSFLKWRFVYVAKKFGVVEKGADYRTVNFNRLVEVFEGTPLSEEAIGKVLWEDLDLERTIEIIRRIETGDIKFEVGALSPIGKAGLEHSRELIMPQRADHSILVALGNRLEDEVLHLTCVNCTNQWRMKPKDAPKKTLCPRCGSRMVAVLHPYNRDIVKLLKKPNPNEEEKREIQRMYKSANLVMEHGKRALVALSGRGVGPDTAARILSGFYDNEDEFLRDILSAEMNYARTKKFWD
jgi:ATP-dependent Lhr-like helicase